MRRATGQDSASFETEGGKASTTAEVAGIGTAAEEAPTFRRRSAKEARRLPIAVAPLPARQALKSAADGAVPRQAARSGEVGAS